MMQKGRYGCAAILVAVLSGVCPAAEIIDKVACKAAPEQSYALYLPSVYDETKQWPVLICFDPGARGRVPVERFREGAEKYGWIVAGSNNSRNGPMERSRDAAVAVWNDIQSRYAIDPKRVYFAGMSGGARVASQVALASGWAAGLIVSGATFPGADAPKQAIRFPWFGAAGSEDFNRSEVTRVGRALGSQGVTAKIRIFEGTHEWLPTEVATEAIAWMQHPQADPVPDKKTLKAEMDIERRELQLVEQVYRAARGDSVEFRGQVALVRKAAEARQDSVERQMNRRVLGSLFGSFREGARESFDRGDYRGALQVLDLAAMVRPEAGGIDYEKARCYEKLGNAKKAAEYFEKAEGKGFRPRGDGAPEVRTR